MVRGSPAQCCCVRTEPQTALGQHQKRLNPEALKTLGGLADSIRIEPSGVIHHHANLAGPGLSCYSGPGGGPSEQEKKGDEESPRVGWASSRQE
ncbi:MAG: hypothetical protein M3441_20050 [Chloroflexota bacterium]|nr:hypothetical protein [Chloroflexota bacterium]